MTTIEFPLKLGYECKHAMSGESNPNERGLIPQSFGTALLDQLIFLDTYDIEEMSIVEDALHLTARYTGIATSQRASRVLTWEMDRSKDGFYAANLYKIDTQERKQDESQSSFAHRCAEVAHELRPNAMVAAGDSGDEYNNYLFPLDRATLNTLLFANLYTIEEMSVKDGRLELQTRYVGPETPADMMRVFTWDTQLIGLEGVVQYGVVPVNRQPS